MKYIITYISSIVAIAILLAGCTTQEKFSVYVTPGSTVTFPAPEQGKILKSTDKSKQLAINSDCYMGYVNLQNPDNGMTVPMGLDIRKKSRLLGGIGKTGLWTGCVVEGTGLLFVVAGALAGEDDGDGLMVGGGCAVGAGGALALASVPLLYRSNQLSYRYHFTYADKQNLEIPLLSTNLLSPDPPKEGSNESVTRKKKKVSASSSGTQTSKGYSKTKKKQSDLAAKVSGSYTGTGQLLAGKSIEEVYPEITVELTPHDKTHVLMIVKEDGEEYFEEPILLQIKASKSGYILTCPDIPAITMTVSKGTLNFTHPKVKIDDDTYTVTFKAKK